MNICLIKPSLGTRDTLGSPMLTNPSLEPIRSVPPVWGVPAAVLGEGAVELGGAGGLGAAEDGAGAGAAELGGGAAAVVEAGAGLGAEVGAAEVLGELEQPLNMIVIITRMDKSRNNDFFI